MSLQHLDTGLSCLQERAWIGECLEPDGLRFESGQFRETETRSIGDQGRNGSSIGNHCLLMFIP